MKAMVLAAGRGERLRPLTDTCPKPLLEAGGKALIVHLVERLAAAGFTDLVINESWLGERLHAALGDGGALGVRVAWSPEPAGALETGGGIRHALERLGPAPFAVVNGDIWTDYPFERLPRTPDGLAHLVLVDNPAHNPRGDFTLADGRVGVEGGARLTFSGIAVYRPALLAAHAPGRFPIAPLLRCAAARGEVGGEHYRGGWTDVGTPERLAALDRRLRGAG